MKKDKKDNKTDEVFDNILKIMSGDFFVNKKKEKNGTK